MNEYEDILESVTTEIIDFKKYEILGHISRCDDLKQQEKWLSLIAHTENFKDKSFTRLWAVVNVDCIRGQCEVKSYGDYDEFYIHSLFKKHISSVIKGATIVEKKRDPHHLPDAFIRFHAQAIPVEMKKGAFDLKALNQLKRYCKHYKSRKAVAVGSKLTVKLPAEWIFVSTDELLKLEPEKSQKTYRSPLDLTPLECAQRIKSEILLGISEKDYWNSQLSFEDKCEAHLAIAKYIMSLFWPKANRLFITYNVDQSTLVYGFLHPKAFDEF